MDGEAVGYDPCIRVVATPNNEAAPTIYLSNFMLGPKTYCALSRSNRMTSSPMCVLVY